MNLFVEDMARYVIEEWDRVLTAVDGTKEARFIVQSLDPQATFALFMELDQHRLSWLTQYRIECHFRVATGLWDDWCRTYAKQQLDQDMAARGALGPNGERLWVDEEDRLTKYRNLTRAPGVDGLVVVLVGLNHATDQGGLADFHQAHEARMWQRMGQGFSSWVRRVCQRLDLPESHSEIDSFDILIQQLFQARPLRLARLAEFIEERVIAGSGFYSLNEVIERFSEQLPFWGIPPLLANGQGAELRGKQGATALKEADAFISHQRYKSAAGQKKDWKKIDQSLSDPDFELPQTLDDGLAYESIDIYRDTLRAFIFEADADARERLLRTDFMPLLEILKQRTPRGATRETIKLLKGMSFEVLLRGVWSTLNAFMKEYGGNPLADILGGVHVELIRFDHDLTADDEEGVGTEKLARELLQGCLGGLEEVFAGIDWCLPRDEDQARLPRDRWERRVPITLDLALDSVKFGTSRARPNVQFKVLIARRDGDGERKPFSKVFKWGFDPTQPERVRFQCAKTVRERWLADHQARILPVFQITSDVMTALYFAADADEANRLIAQALTRMRLEDLLQSLPRDQLDPTLWDLTAGLIDAYRDWLDCAVDKGYYRARAERSVPLLDAFERLAEAVLDTGRLGSAELLRRVYKAFLVVDEGAQPNAAYLTAAIAWGLSPAVLELTDARVWFLANGFPEAAAELAVGGNGKVAFNRLLDLAEIRRPLTALIVDAQRHLYAEIKSFGLLHCLGREPSTERSLGVQTLLRDEESDDDEEIADIIGSGERYEDRDVVARVLNDYRQLFPFAEDGMRILAINVKVLATILSGVDHFLKGYLKRTSADWPPFHCTVTVYTTSASPTAMENRLALWRNHVMETYRGQGRGLILSVGHRYAPKGAIVELLKQEGRLYDIVFLFHFLRDELAGDADPALPFAYDFSGWSGGRFPICEYPRPIQAGDRDRRQSLLSNRRLRIQTRHADLSARLRYTGNSSRNHLIVGQIDYSSWAGIVETLHRTAQWVVCVDPYVDKHLLCCSDAPERRKIVGFTSGLGAYGELNLTISTEMDSLKRLTELVAGQLTRLLPFEKPDEFETMAVRVVSEAEEVIGLASLRAVVGQDERLREVVGFAAIRRALAQPPGEMSQLLPVDSLTHWFAGSEVTRRPDLLQLSLQARQDDIPLVRAVLIECKLAEYNPVHLAKAREQVQQGLSHLTQLLAPNHCDIRRTGFDRRYWWAQLHRAITSRSVVHLSEQKWRELDRALESLAEGDFEIRWQGAIFTFWTNEAGAQPTVTPLALPSDTIQPPFEVPADFAIWHVALGYEGISALFAEARPAPLLAPGDTAIPTRPDHAGFPQTVGAIPSIQQPPEETASVAPPVSATPSDIPPTGVSHIATSVSNTPSHTPPAHPAVLAADAFRVPEKLLIGTRSNGDPVYWHFGHPQLPNRHLLIFGTSGSGKTYGIQCLLAEMAQQRLRSLIVDYTDGFLPQQMEARFAKIATPKSHFVVTERLPLNPFRRQQQIIDPSIPAIEETPYQVATRIESIFASVFEIGDQQSAALIRVLQAGIEEEPGFTLDGVLPRLRADSPYGESLANKLEPLIRSQPFREGEGSAWEAMLTSPESWVHVLQLKGLAREIQKMVTEFVLWDLWDYAQNTGSKDRPIPIVLDEIQNLDHSSDSPIDKMLREGRKFGLSLILATQNTSQFNQEQRDRLFQAGYKLFFKPATTEIDRFAQLLAQSTTGVSKADWSQRLARLAKGQCWSLGPVVKSGGTFKEEAMLVSVTPLEERNLVG